MQHSVPVYRISPKSEITGKIKILHYVDSDNHIYDELISTHDIIKIGNYTITAKIYSNRLTQHDIKNMSEYPIFYVSFDYFSQISKGVFFTMSFHLVMNSIDKQYLKSIQQYENYIYAGHWIQKCNYNDIYHSTLINHPLFQSQPFLFKSLSHLIQYITNLCNNDDVKILFTTLLHLSFEQRKHDLKLNNYASYQIPVNTTNIRDLYKKMEQNEEFYFD
jgi:hypothetical protein